LIEAQATLMTTMIVGSTENAMTISGQTSVDKKSNPDDERETRQSAQCWQWRNARSNHNPPKATCVDSIPAKTLSSIKLRESKI